MTQSNQFTSSLRAEIRELAILVQSVQYFAGDDQQTVFDAIAIALEFANGSTKVTDERIQKISERTSRNYKNERDERSRNVDLAADRLLQATKFALAAMQIERGNGDERAKSNHRQQTTTIGEQVKSHVATVKALSGDQKTPSVH